MENKTPWAGRLLYMILSLGLLFEKYHAGETEHIAQHMASSMSGSDPALGGSEGLRKGRSDLFV
jgi:hypothetical protein